MAKIIFVAVLAFLVLQGSNASLSKDGSVKELIQDLNTLISEVSSRSSSFVLELNNNFSELQEAANIPFLLSEIKKEAQQTLSQSEFVAKDCKDWANMRIYLLEREASVMNCRFTVDDDAVELRKQLQELVKKVENLLKEIGQDVFRCLRSEDFDKCMEDKVDDVKREVETVEKSIQEIFDALEASVPMITDKMSQCVEEKKQSLLVKMLELSSDLENCAKASNVMPINHLVKKTNQVNELPVGFTIFSDKINEIAIHHNINSQIDDLKKEVDKLLAVNEKDERLCGPKAQEFITALVKDAENNEQVCLNRAQSKAKDLQDKMALLNGQIESLTELLGPIIRDCKRQNIRDVKGFFVCMEEKTKDLNQKLHLLEKEAMQVSYLTMKSIKEVQQQLDDCLAKVENKIVLEARAIISGLNQCIQNVGMLYTRQEFNYILADIDVVVFELREEVENLLIINDKIERLCGPKGRDLVEALAKEVQTDAEQCLKIKDLQNLDVCLTKTQNRATLEGRAIVYGLNQCIRNSELLRY